MSRDLASYARSGAWSLVAQAAQFAGAIAVSIAVVRALDTEQIGILSIARQLTALVTVVSGLALERALLRFVPELVREAGPSAARGFVLGTMLLRGLGWGICFGAVWAFGARLDAVLGSPIAGPARVGVATAAVFSLHNHLRAAATARFATDRVALGSTVGNLATLVFTLVALARGAGVEGVLIAAAAGVLAGTVLLVPVVLARETVSSLENVVGGGRPLGLTDARLRAYALPFFGIAVLNYAVHSQTEVFFLGHWHGPELAGFFSHGFSFAQRLIDFLPLALWEVSVAGFSRIVLLEPERLGSALRAYLKLLYLVVAPLAAFGIGFSHPAILFLYGDKMLPSVGISQAYFFLAAIAAFGAPVGMILYARERVGAALSAYVVFAVVNLGLDLALIPRFALAGAVVGLGAAKLLSVVLMTRLAAREIPGGLGVPWSWLARVFLASAPGAAWVLVQDRFVDPLAVALGGLASVVAVVLAFRALEIVGPREVALIRGTRLPLREAALRVVCRPSALGAV